MKSIRHSVVFLVGLMGLVQGFFGGGGLMAKGFSADSIAPKMQWFADAKLGIFIHWGIYAVEGTSESWSFHSRNTTYPYYMGQLKGFGAEKYDPKAWATLIKVAAVRLKKTPTNDTLTGNFC